MGCKKRLGAERLESRCLLAAEGEAFTFSTAVDVQGNVEPVEMEVTWGDGTTSTVPIDPPGTSPLRVRFDYTYDSTGFFNQAIRRQRLQDAADALVGQFTDTLDAIRPSGSNRWTPAIFNPRTGSQVTLPGSLSIAANEIVIYVGARNFSGSQVAEAVSGYFTFAQGSQDWLDTVRSRGEVGALADNPTDVGTWGGSMAFDEPRDWFFGADIAEIGAEQNDFYSVAIHELAHVLGFGIVLPGAAQSSWETLVQGNQFTGARSRALYGGNVPLSQGGGHWDFGVTSDGQETAMDPNLLRGQRKRFTSLDFAAMNDIGWTLRPRMTRVTVDHVYGDDGRFPVQWVVRDRVGVLDTGQRTATIRNANPQLVVPLTATARVNETWSVPDIAVIEDAGYGIAGGAFPSDETFLVTVDWGDGTSAPATPATIDRLGRAGQTTLASLDASHVYEAIGSYNVTVTVTDDDGGEASETFVVDVLPPRSPFQNPVDRFDVDNNGEVEAFDALRVIFALNRAGGPTRLDPDSTPVGDFIDVNGDYRLDPVDALDIIFELNRRSRASQASGEAVAARDAGLVAFTTDSSRRELQRWRRPWWQREGEGSELTP